MIASKTSKFIRMFYDSYRNNYRAWDWDYNCARVPYQLYLQRPDLLHVEPYKFTTPDWSERYKLWKDTIDWKDLYVIHAMSHITPDTSKNPETMMAVHSDPDTIKSMSNTFGEVVRYIYYGSPDPITS